MTEQENTQDDLIQTKKKNKITSDLKIQIAFTFAMFLVIVLIIFLVIVPTKTSIVDTYKYVSLPLIKSTSIDENGQAHNIEANVSLGGDYRALNSLSNIDTTTIVQDSISNIKYEDLIEVNGLEILKYEILTNINTELENTQIDKVYISGIDVGIKSSRDMVNRDKVMSEEARKQQMEEMFPGGSE